MGSAGRAAGAGGATGGAGSTGSRSRVATGFGCGGENEGGSALEADTAGGFGTGVGCTARGRGVRLARSTRDFDLGLEGSTRERRGAGEALDSSILGGEMSRTMIGGVSLLAE